MAKNDSGIKSATGLTGSGARDWVMQRISAVILAVYSVVLLGFFVTQDANFETWHGFMTSLPMRLFSLLALLALSAHAWVGMWTVFTDYITSRKLGASASAIRFVLQTLVIVAIIVFLFWGVMIFWGNAA